jgi:hypothetical protein
MPDAFVRMRKGETRPLYGRAGVVSGSLTILGGGVYTLFNSAGAAVAGHDSQPVTGYDDVISQSPRVWFNLNTESPADLAPGWYTLVFRFSALGGDGILRTYVPSVGLQVLGAEE